MSTPHTVSPYVIAVAAILLFWRVGIRLRRSIGRQHFRLHKLKVSAFLLPLLLLLLLLLSVSVHPINAVAQAIGVGTGGLISQYGLRTTKFEVTELGHFYTPNPYVGTAVVALFLAKAVYLLAGTYAATGGFNVSASEDIANPFNIFVAGVVLGYYSWLAWGLLRWYKRTSSPSGRRGLTTRSS
jgi:hypothetical protein